MNPVARNDLCTYWKELCGLFCNRNQRETVAVICHKDAFEYQTRRSCPLRSRTPVRHGRNFTLLFRQ